MRRKTTGAWPTYVEPGAAYSALEADALRRKAASKAIDRYTARFVGRGMDGCQWMGLDDINQAEEAMSQVTSAASEHEHAAPREAWDAIAAGYDSFVTPGEVSLATAALRLAGLRPGDRFVDVAAGTGGLSLPAARMGAKVVATDWAPQMIERFATRVREEGLPDAVGRVMDCHALDLADQSFDIAGSQFGVMLVPDQQQAIREMVRVTRPGGRVLMIAYGSPAKFEALQLFIGALVAVLPDFDGLPADPPPLEFQVADPEVLERRLIEAGLKDVVVHTDHAEEIEIRSGLDLWNWCLGSNPIPNMLVADLTDEQRGAVQSQLDRAINQRPGTGVCAVLTAAVNIGIGTR